MATPEFKMLDTEDKLREEIARIRSERKARYYTIWGLFLAGFALLYVFAVCLVLPTQLTAVHILGIGMFGLLAAISALVITLVQWHARTLAAAFGNRIIMLRMKGHMGAWHRPNRGSETPGSRPRRRS